MPVETLVPYLPRLVLNRLAADPRPLPPPAAARFPAALLFADISGFTPLAEQLAEQGPAGTEQLTAVLNAYFGQLISSIAAYGGDVVKFAGDALFAVWPATGESLAEATSRAAACGLDIQARLQTYTPPEGARLRLHIGIGAGEVLTVHVGGVGERYRFLLSGGLPAQLSVAEQAARPGDVVLSPEAWALVAERCAGQVLPGGGARLAAVHVAPPPPPADGALPPAAGEAALRAYLPDSILARLDAGQTAWLAELRRATVLFLKLDGLDPQAPTLPDELQAVMETAQAVLNRYEGSVREFLTDDKGTLLIASWGLPPLAHEDDAARAALAARALQEGLAAQGRRCSMGLASGRVFCGEIGNAWRREYTFIGDTVNLAARLMQRAAGDIFCDAATAQAASAQVRFAPLPAITVKGKAQPVAVFRPLGPAEEQAARPPVALIGRAAERALLAARLEQLCASGEDSVVLIEGEAGLGKSRLVEELDQQAAGLGLRLLTGSGEAIERSAAYHAWRPVFRQLFGLDRHGGGGEPLRRAVLARMQGHAEWLRLLPLLNAVLPLDLPDNEVTRQMSGQVRADNTRELLLGLLDTLPGPTPLVLILEDAHWFDSASWGLALAASRAATPGRPARLLVVTARPLPDPAPPEYLALRAGPGTRRLVLESLSPEETLALVCRRLGVASIPEPVAALIGEKAEGNPFFSEELAYALRDAGLIEIRDGVCYLAAGATALQALDFPDTLQGVITSRIDRLTPTQQLTLKVASVIGRVFAFRILRAVHPLESEERALAGELTDLQRMDLTLLEAPEPDLTYIFKHIITQEVAYNLMLFAQRRELHRAIATWYEQAHAGDLAPFYPLLAYHWDHAGAAVPTRTYLALAGEQALRDGAYQEAVRFFSDALARGQGSGFRVRGSGFGVQGSGDGSRASARDEHIIQNPKLVLERSEGSKIQNALEGAHWERQLGEAYYGLGQLAESAAHLERAVALLGWPAPAGQGAVVTSLARQVGQQALHRLRQAVQGTATPPDERGAWMEAARAYNRLAEIYGLRHDLAPTIDACLRTVNLAEQLGPSAEAAQGYATLAYAANLLSPALTARYLRLAQAAARQAGDLTAQGWVYEMTGICQTVAGQWAAAQAALTQADAIFHRLGNRRQRAETQAQSTFVAYRRGALAQGAALGAELYTYFRQQSDLQGQTVALLMQAETALLQGRTDPARAWCEAAIRLMDEHEAIREGHAIWGTGLLALALLRGGEPEQAGQVAAGLLDPIRRSRFNQPWTLGGHPAVAEVCLALAERGYPAPAAAPAGWQAAARSVCRALRLFARPYAFLRPAVSLYEGLGAWQAGHPAAARTAWRASLATARRLAQPYEQARAHYEIGRHLAAGHPARAGHLGRACRLFAQLGAAYDLERAQAAADAST